MLRLITGLPISRGSTSRRLLEVSRTICVDRMHLPANVRDYIMSLYGKFKGKVRTSNQVSEEFSGGSFESDDFSHVFQSYCGVS